MKSGYDQFFKNARKNASPGKPVETKSNSGGKSVKPQRQFSTSNVHFELSDEDLESQLKQRMGMSSRPKKKRKTIPWKLMAFTFVGLVAAAWGIQNFEDVEKSLKRVEISFLGEAFAEAPKSPATAKQKLQHPLPPPTKPQRNLRIPKRKEKRALLPPPLALA
jgi:hypothetical protein